MSLSDAEYIDAMLDLVRTGVEFSDPTVYTPIQIADGNMWRGVFDEHKLTQTRNWWKKTYRMAYRFFQHAVKKRKLKVPIVIVAVPRRIPNTSLMYPGPQAIVRMLSELNVRAIALSHVTSTFEVNAYAVFSDEDATILSAHFSVETDLQQA